MCMKQPMLAASHVHVRSGDLDRGADVWDWGCGVNVVWHAGWVVSCCVG